MNDRIIYPNGIYEFDTSDRSAPNDNPPAMVRLVVTNKHEMAGMIDQLMRAILNHEDRISMSFSGKLTEVNE